MRATEADLTAALFGERPAVYCHLAELGGAVAGFAVWFLNFSTWLGRHGVYLEDLYVRPAYRGQGVGRALLAELTALAGDRGYGRVEWWVLDWNEPAHAFYRTLGAEPMDEWTVWRLAGDALRGRGSDAGFDGAADVGGEDSPGDQLVGEQAGGGVVDDRE